MYNVMLVDDVEVFRKKMKRMKLWNHSVFHITEEAADGEEALIKLRNHKMDVVITDIKMPKVDGMELLKVIKEEKLAEYVILLSDYTEFEYAREGIILGAFDYIGKSMKEQELEDIFSRLENQLQKKRGEYIVNQRKDSDKELDEIVEMMARGDFCVVQRVEGLMKVQIANARLIQVDDRSILVVKEIWNKLMSKIEKEYSWIRMYCKVELYFKLEVLQTEYLEEVIQAFETHILYVTSVFQSCIICFDDPLIRNTCQYILSHVNERCAVTDIAKKMYVSKSHLSEQFKHKTKMTLVEYTTHIRMERAKILLKKTNLRNYEIAYQLGYQYGDYFGKVFHKYTGMSLIEFRQMEEKDDKKGETVDK